YRSQNIGRLALLNAEIMAGHASKSGIYENSCNWLDIKTTDNNNFIKATMYHSIEYILELLAIAGVQEAYLFCREHFEIIKDYIKKLKWSRSYSPIKIITIVTPEARSSKKQVHLIGQDGKTNECVHCETVELYPRKHRMVMDMEIDICSVELYSPRIFDNQEIRKDFVYGILTSDLLRKPIYCHLVTHCNRDNHAWLVKMLREVHLLGIIHRDLKPSNLPLQYDNSEDSTVIPRVLISDFGECEILDQLSERDRPGATGTLEIMAPELLTVDERGRYFKEYYQKSDMWLLGMVLYYLCYSRPILSN
ncbi:8236_t:CDS:10, partial [Cetraspora pellucida]